jgi:glycine/D-amino acid oxidase-like deaminating enzyme
VRHTRHGWWLEEAGRVEPLAPLAGDLHADVAVVGGGYLGLWSAWHLAEAGADVVVLEAEVCGHGPSGRNGGFVSSLWDQLPGLVARFGPERAVEVGRASADAVAALGAWCEAEGVEAWYRPAPQLELATTPAQDGAWEAVARACADAGLDDECRVLSAPEVQEICASPVFRGGLALRTSATVQPARLVLGLRRRLLERGVRIHEHSPVLRLGEHAETAGGRVVAGATVLAVNSATAGFPGFGRALAVASSHIVLTEPVPEVLEELGWTGGEALADARTLLHYFRTTPDGRIAFGWGGGRMGYGARLRDVLELDADAVRHAGRSLVHFFPQLAGRRITHAWGGPIDVSPTHLPSFGSRGRVQHGYGFTGNGVGPSYLGGRILASLALDRRDDVSRLALVEPAPTRFPPEPLRFVGGSAIRRALVASDAAADSGRRPGPVTRLVASLPRRLGLHLPR